MISFVAAGDSMIRDHLPHTPEFQKVRDFLKRGDIRFTNLEAAIVDDTCFANTFSGGGYVFTQPEVLEDLIISSVNEAIRQADSTMNSAMNAFTSGLGLGL